jgi:hypothetical protein
MNIGEATRPPVKIQGKSTSQDKFIKQENVNVVSTEDEACDRSSDKCRGAQNETMVQVVCAGGHPTECNSRNGREESNDQCLALKKRKNKISGERPREIVEGRTIACSHPSAINMKMKKFLAS